MFDIPIEKARAAKQLVLDRLGEPDWLRGVALSWDENCDHSVVVLVLDINAEIEVTIQAAIPPDLGVKVTIGGSILSRNIWAYFRKLKSARDHKMIRLGQVGTNFSE